MTLYVVISGLVTWCNYYTFYHFLAVVNLNKAVARGSMIGSLNYFLGVR